MEAAAREKPDLYLLPESPWPMYLNRQARGIGALSRDSFAALQAFFKGLQKTGNPKNIRSLNDLLRPGLKLGLGDPKACAIGRKASKIFAKNGIAEADVNRNVSFRSLTVNELGNHIKLGMLDAAIVWDAVAAYFADEADVVPIPRQQNVISTAAVGVLTCSTDPQTAEKFAAFVASPQGRKI